MPMSVPATILLALLGCPYVFVCACRAAAGKLEVSLRHALVYFDGAGLDDLPDINIVHDSCTIHQAGSGTLCPA